MRRLSLSSSSSRVVFYWCMDGILYSYNKSNFILLIPFQFKQTKSFILIMDMASRQIWWVSVVLQSNETNRWVDSIAMNELHFMMQIIPHHRIEGSWLLVSKEAVELEE